MSQDPLSGKRGVDQAVQTVNARELHGFLGVGKDFSDWIKTQVDRARLIEGRHYIKVAHSPEKGTGNRGARIDYHLTLHTHKTDRSIPAIVSPSVKPV